MSVSFDRAADYYDQTRLLPEPLITYLLPFLPRDEMCVEIGVGTGRIAIPLVENGIEVVGVDISPEMLRKLVAKRRTEWPQVAIADATKLPFPDNTFGAAIAAHVLHLIPEWRSAVDESLRVLRPGGLLIATRGGQSRALWNDEIHRRFFREAGDPPWPPGIDSLDELDRYVTRFGIKVHAMPELVTKDSLSINRLLAILEAGYWAACWSIDPDTRRRAADATRMWARGAFGDLDLEREHVESTVWHSYRLPK